MNGEEESDHEDPYPSLDGGSHSSSSYEGEEGSAESSHSSLSASS